MRNGTQVREEGQQQADASNSTPQRSDVEPSSSSMPPAPAADATSPSTLSQHTQQSTTTQAASALTTATAVAAAASSTSTSTASTATIASVAAATATSTPQPTTSASAVNVAAAAATPPPPPSQPPPPAVVVVPAAEHQMFAGLRSTMERNAQNWRSNFTNVVLRPLVQHRVQQHHHHHHHHSQPQQAPQQQQLQLHHNHSGSSAAAAAANNLLQHWMPTGSRSTAATSSNAAGQPPNSSASTAAAATPMAASVVINLEGGNVGAGGGGAAAIFQPAGGYSLIDINRLVNNGGNANAAGASSASAERPTQFDARRAQILADLQNEAPQPNPSSRADAVAAAAGAGAGNGGGGGGGGVGAQTSDIFVQIPEARQLVDALMRYLPYVFILAFKYMIDHMDGILNVAMLIIMFSHANWMLKKQISRQKFRSIFALLRELAYVSVVLLFVGMMLGGAVGGVGGGAGGGGGDGGGDWPWLELWSMPSDGQLASEWPLRRLLYNVLITDMVAKLVTVHVKICVTLLPPCVVNYRNRGRVYLFLEGMSQFVRSLLPVLPWVLYLMKGYTGYDKVFGVILTATYIVAKGNDLMRTTTLAKDGLLELFKIVRIGANPTKEELQAAGDQCPICHDTYTDPLRLSCTHIFCEACVATWFDREPTCPLCRALVGDDPSWRDGATSHFIQFY